MWKECSASDSEFVLVLRIPSECAMFSAPWQTYANPRIIIKLALHYATSTSRTTVTANWILDVLQSNSTTCLHRTISCWIPKATDTQNVYLLTAFILQQWLTARASILLHTCTAYLVFITQTFMRVKFRLQQMWAVFKTLNILSFCHIRANI